MIDCKTRQVKRMRKKLNRYGFSMAELLMVVAILVALFGVAFVAVQNHQRSMTRLEFDGIAKEIYVAAQNHLTMAEGQGFFGIKDIDDIKSDADKESVYGKPVTGKTRTYFFVVNKGEGSIVFKANAKDGLVQNFNYDYTYTGEEGTDEIHNSAEFTYGNASVGELPDITDWYKLEM